MQDNDEDVGNSDSEKTGAPQLTSIELRVLGALMEKQLTTPDVYPLTLNSLLTACNQKSSRDPISHYQQGEVLRTLQELQDKQFVRKEPGSRADKFSQQFISRLELGKKHQAVLCVMALRGPQTLSELNTRTQRMFEFSKEELQHCIERLCNRETPYVIRLGQQAGQREERFGHLFSGVPDLPSSSADIPAATVAPTANTKQDDTITRLEMEVASLQEAVRSLQSETSDLKKQLDELYQLIDKA